MQKKHKMMLLLIRAMQFESRFWCQLLMDQRRWRAKANVTVASVEDKPEIVASRKVKLVADVLLNDVLELQYDLIFLPGGISGAEAFSRSSKLVGLLKKQAESDKLYGAMCASPAIVLEPHGLLKGKKATAYPAMCDKLLDQSECENRVVVDGSLVTSRGPGTTMEFALGIVEKLFGRETSLDVSKSMVFIWALAYFLMEFPLDLAPLNYKKRMILLNLECGKRLMGTESIHSSQP